MGFCSRVRLPVCILRLTHFFMKRGLNGIPVAPRSLNENHTASATTITRLSVSSVVSAQFPWSPSLNQHVRGRTSRSLSPGGQRYPGRPECFGPQRHRGAQRNGEVRGHPGGHSAGVRQPGSHGTAANLLRSPAVRHLLQVQGNVDFEQFQPLALIG